MELPERVRRFQLLLTSGGKCLKLLTLLLSLIDRCEDDEAASLRIKCGHFCRELYDGIFPLGAGDSPSHTSSYLLAAMVDLHADKLEIEGSRMTAGEREEELEKANKVPWEMSK